MSHVDIKMTRVNVIKLIIMTRMMGVPPIRNVLGLLPAFYGPSPLSAAHLCPPNHGQRNAGALKHPKSRLKT